MRLAALLLLVVSARAGIVDRVAVAVGNKVITQSEIELRIRLTAFQNQATPDFSTESRRLAAERLIDQRLVEKEMDVGRYPRLAAARALELVGDYEQSDYSGDHLAFLAALGKYDLTEDDVAGDLARQSDLLTFLSLRFRPSVQVSNGPDEKRLEESGDSELDLWLRDQRKRIRIDYVDKGLAPEAAAK
jgi:hypothetical protein